MSKELAPGQLDQVLEKSDLATLGLTEDQLCGFKTELLTALAAYEERAPFEIFKASTRDEIRKAVENAEMLVKSIDRFRTDDYFLKANVGDQSAPNERVLSDTINQLVIFAEEMLKSEERTEGLRGAPFNSLADDPLTSLFFDLLVLRGKFLKKEPPTSIGQTGLTGHHRDYLVFCASLCKPAPEKPLVDRAFERAIEWSRNFKENDFWKEDFA